MTDKFRDYKRYVSDPDWARTYSDYQRKYLVEPRESDKKSARLAKAVMERMHYLVNPPRVLDIGCSTGNFLRHLRTVCPDAEYIGGDLMAPIIEECRNNHDLAGIRFEVMDIFNIPTEPKNDVIIANAVTYLFDPDQFRQVCASIANALRPGGVYIGYELVFPGDREQRVVEKSIAHPEGLQLMLRSEDFVTRALKDVGFSDVEVIQFDIPIDLPKPVPNGTDADLMTYTVRDDITGRRLMYRGS